MHLVFLLVSLFVLACGLALLRPAPKPLAYRRRRSPRPAVPAIPSTARNQRKPDWARDCVLRLYEQTSHSVRDLAADFNRLYGARTGVTVQHAWVGKLLKTHRHQATLRRLENKNRVPPPVPIHRIWAVDTTHVADANGRHHFVLGLLDHGSRLNLLLRRLERFNRWTFLGCLFLAMGRYGKPTLLRLDNHPVHRSHLVRRLLRLAGIRTWFTQPASPWQNGRIERFFGTFKAALAGLVVRDEHHLAHCLVQFRFHYNHVRPHQHLRGMTPGDVWHGIDPLRTPPRTVRWFEGWEGRLKGWVLRH